jgi:hypothetical protein
MPGTKDPQPAQIADTLECPGSNSIHRVASDSFGVEGSSAGIGDCVCRRETSEPRNRASVNGKSSAVRGRLAVNRVHVSKQV